MQETTRDLADKLSDEFLKSGQTQEVWQWYLQNKEGNRTGEVVVIIALRADKEWIDAIERTVTRGIPTFKAAAKPAGQPCPMCGGSGRI